MEKSYPFIPFCLEKLVHNRHTAIERIIAAAIANSWLRALNFWSVV
jgi:hypothetical protein